MAFKMHIKIGLKVLYFLIFVQAIYAQDNASNKDRIKPFIAYELGEAAFNGFQSLSGEIGVRFTNNQMFRITHMNVNLTEAHLSSDFAGAVDGDDVEGKFFGFEAFYDFPVFKGLYISPSFGYYKNEYNHVILNENLQNKSATLGLGIGYRETNLFKVNGLYFMLSFPMRTPLNPIEETMLGSTTINNNRFDNNIWFFVGYEF